MADDHASDAPSTSSSSSQRSWGSVLRWIWRGLFRLVFRPRNVDFEKRLQHLSKEEVAVHARMKRRSHTWRGLARAIVLYSVVIEALVLAFAIVSTRSPDIAWNLRALRVLPVFGLPVLAGLMYSTCSRYHQMRDRKDQRALERLRAERQARIDELKQKTNYYATQELIQRYDLDPTAKAAAASVLAAKLGAESGLNVAFKSTEPSDTSDAGANGEKARSPATEGASSSGLRQRRHSTESPDQSGFLKALEAEMNGQRERDALERDEALDRARVRSTGGGGWLARLAAMLVGEDPTQCYALICRHCHMHNGLAPKEDFRYITYYCPHCHTPNGNVPLPEATDKAEARTPRSTKPGMSSLSPEAAAGAAVVATGAAAAAAADSATSQLTAHTAASEIDEMSS